VESPIGFKKSGDSSCGIEREPSVDEVSLVSVIDRGGARASIGAGWRRRLSGLVA